MLSLCGHGWSWVGGQTECVEKCSENVKWSLLYCITFRSCQEQTAQRVKQHAVWTWTFLFSGHVHVNRPPYSNNETQFTRRIYLESLEVVVRATPPPSGCIKEPFLQSKLVKKWDWVEGRSWSRSLRHNICHISNDHLDSLSSQHSPGICVLAHEKCQFIGRKPFSV